MSRLVSVAKAILDPSKGPVIIKKGLKRLVDRPDRAAQEENLRWIKSNCRDFGEEAEKLDCGLWEEALEVYARLEERAKPILHEVGVDLGGGGFYPMLYFLCRSRMPRVVLETGVAAGFSSQSILEALDKNGAGELFSSDFPYFRFDHADRYIGILVEERLKSQWQLFIKGDEANLPLILDRIGEVDLFHYDSDKSMSGRAYAFGKVLPKMARKGLVVMDDIQDNPFFKQAVESQNVQSFAVYEFGGKFIGMFETP